MGPGPPVPYPRRLFPRTKDAHNRRGSSSETSFGLISVTAAPQLSRGSPMALSNTSPAMSASNRSRPHDSHGRHLRRVRFCVQVPEGRIPPTWKPTCSRKSTCPFRKVSLNWWGRWGSNPRPRDYESPALTTELLPRMLLPGLFQVLRDVCPSSCPSLCGSRRRRPGETAPNSGLDPFPFPMRSVHLGRSRTVASRSVGPFHEGIREPRPSS